MEAAAAGLDGLDLVDDIHALDNLAEDAVAPAVLARIVEEAVVGNVDEELGAGRVRVGGARHGDAADGVLEAVRGLVFDRRARGLLLHAGLEAAALDHEAFDDAVEDGVVVVAGFDVGNEVLDGLRRLLGIEFEGDDAVVGVQLDHVEIPYLVSMSLTDSMRMGLVGTSCWPMALPVLTLEILFTTSMPCVTLPKTQ